MKVDESAVYDLEVRGGTYNDARSAEHLRPSTDEAILLLRSTHPAADALSPLHHARVHIKDSLDIREHPLLDAELNCTRYHCRDNLCPKHRTRWDFHVVAELEVGGKVEALRHADISPGLEHHHRDWTAGQGVSDDELGNDAWKVVSDIHSREDDAYFKPTCWLVIAWRMPTGRM